MTLYFLTSSLIVTSLVIWQCISVPADVIHIYSKQHFVLLFDIIHSGNYSDNFIQSHTRMPWYCSQYWSSCGLHICSSVLSTGKWFFSSPKHPDQFWDPFSLLINQYQSSFPRGQVARAWSSQSSHLVPRLTEWSHTSTFLHASMACRETFLCFCLYRVWLF